MTRATTIALLLILSIAAGFFAAEYVKDHTSPCREVEVCELQP